MGHSQGHAGGLTVGPEKAVASRSGGARMPTRRAESSGGPALAPPMQHGLRHPRHPEHHSASEWTPAGFDPESFDAEATTKLLQRFHGKPRSRARRATSRHAR